MSPDGERFPPAARLSNRAEIERVRREGKRVRTASIEARVTASLCASTRVGIVVPKYGRSSVERNRLKRRLRELVRRTWLPQWRASAPLDVLVRVLPVAYARAFDALGVELQQLGARVDRQRTATEGA
ncbi:MAG: ribonuclease P protein component [Gemmatimonadaceae bacterium]|nr:ribonuclease P protein component [Gemmatimonadaceae bacterium]